MIACVPFKKASSARVVLAQLYKGVHAVFQDHKLDRVCYMMTHPQVDVRREAEESNSKIRGSQGAALSARRLKEKLKDVMDHSDVLNEFTAWHYMHPVMKIHPSVLNHLFKTETKFDEVSTMHKLDGFDKKRSDRDFATEDLRYELLVEFVPKVEGSADRETIMGDMHEHLHSTDNTHDLLKKMQEHHPDGRELWEMGQHCPSASIFDSSDPVSSSSSSARMLFTSIADEYYHGFKIMSDHLHGWGDRQDHRRLSKIDKREMAADVGGIGEGCYVALLAKLSQHPEVLSISLRPRLRLANDAAKSVIMSNNNSIPATTEDQKYLWSLQNVGLDGTGQVITIADTGLDQDHCFYAGDSSDTGVAHISYGTTTYDNSYRKVIQYVAFVDSEDGDGHGTHVAGSAVGSNYDTNSNDFDGMAVGGKIAFFDIGYESSGDLDTPTVYSNMYVAAANAGARVFSGAFGYSYNYYSRDSISVDSYSYETNPYFLSIYSAGNEGQEGWYTVIDPSQAKNALSVGASEASFHGSATYYRDGNRDYVPYFSSVGPTFDYRYKPEVLVPGMMIDSAEDRTTCGVKGYKGTSMSAGVLGGATLILRQYLTNNTYGSMEDKRFYSSRSGHLYGPSAALMKAALVNSARQMERYNVPTYASGTEPTTILRQNLNLTGDTYNEDPADNDAVGVSAQRPDFVQGFGRVDLSNIIPVPVESHGESYPGFNASFHDFGMYENDADYWWITMPSTLDTSVGARGLKVTIAWMDYPNSVVSEKFLLHDLDLIIERVADNMTCTVESPTSTFPIWFGNGGSEPDTHNNVEMIHIPAEALVAGGTYRILTRSKNFVSGVNYQFYAQVSTYPPGSYIAFGDGKNSRGICDGSTFMDDYWQKSMCPQDTHMETELYLTSHRGDGWSDAGSYTIKDTADDSVVKTGTMPSHNAMTSIREKVTVCLDASSSYEVELVDSNSTDEWGLYNMGILSSQCKLKLQGQYDTKDTIQISANNDGAATDDATGMTSPWQCNPCASDEVQLNLLLWSSRYGGKISYGWNNAAYQISGVATNKPNAGIIEHHLYCLDAGQDYDIGFSALSTDDDFANSGAAESGFAAGSWGYEEYEVDVSMCKSYEGNVYSSLCGYTVPCMRSFTADCPLTEDDDTDGTTSMVAIAIIVLSIVACCALGACIMHRMLKPQNRGAGNQGEAGRQDGDAIVMEMANASVNRAGNHGHGVPLPAQARVARVGQHEGVTEVQAIPIPVGGGFMGGGGRPQYQTVHVQEQPDHDPRGNQVLPTYAEAQVADVPAPVYAERVG